MRKIFLDCGAWDGTSAKFFRANQPDGKDFDIYSFECLPANINKLIKVANDDKKMKVIPKAVWINDCYMNFYTGMTESGTFYKSKRTGNVRPENNIIVEAIDFIKWLTKNVKKEDYIILKLNIEGAEYVILRTLHENRMLDWFDKFYIQWHWDKIKIPKQVHDNIKALVPVHHSWNAMLNKVDEFKKTL